MSLDEKVDHISILVDRTPEIVPPTPYVHEELVQVPRVSQTTLTMSEPPGVLWSELPTPLPDGLVGDDDPALR